jgi:hypothetical protein
MGCRNTAAEAIFDIGTATTTTPISPRPPPPHTPVYLPWAHEVVGTRVAVRLRGGRLGRVDVRDEVAAGGGEEAAEEQVVGDEVEHACRGPGCTAPHRTHGGPSEGSGEGSGEGKKEGR